MNQEGDFQMQNQHRPYIFNMVYLSNTLMYSRASSFAPRRSSSDLWGKREREASSFLSTGLHLCNLFGAALAFPGVSKRLLVSWKAFRPMWRPSSSSSSSRVKERLGMLRSWSSGANSSAHDDDDHDRDDHDGGVGGRLSHLYGFKRPHMYKDSLHGTVLPYQKHVFLCFREPSNWPPQIEMSPSPSYELPRLLANSLKAHKSRMPKKTRLTVCRGCDHMESSRGTVLVFPEMVKYKDLTSSDIEGFVEEVLVHEREWPFGRVEKLKGSHVFVCAHASRDMRCGVCGPALIERFKKEISIRGLGDLVFVRPCSHVGGHKYAGNVIIYGKDANGGIAGHWYGYVTPEDVAILLDEHIGKGQIINKLWRGQMGLAEEGQKQDA